MRRLVNRQKKLKIIISTNGGYFKEQYWELLANKLNTDYIAGTIQFCLDGLDNKTHGIYRKNILFDTVMRNAQAYIKAGGKAVWVFIEFEHNTHQLKEARERSIQLGFKGFKVKTTRYKKLIIADDTKTKNSALVKSNTYKKVEKEVKQSITQYGTTKRMIELIPVRCHAHEDFEYYVEFDGTVWPCCLVYSYVYGDKKPTDKISNNIRNVYEPGFNNLNKHSIEEILNHPFFDELQESLVTNDRMKNCAIACGKHKDKK